MFDEEFGSFYKTVGGAEGDKCYYPTRLDPYGKLKFKEIRVCDDVQNHYDYFEENINFNPNDCCNLTL